MNRIQSFFRILLLCGSLLFLAKNASAQCSGFSVTATQTSDGGFLGDATATATITGGSANAGLYWIVIAPFPYFNDTITGLTAGTYCVYAYDSTSAGFCDDTFCLTISDTGVFNCANMVSTVYESDSCQINDIFLSSSVAGGSGSYSYLWNTGDTLYYLSNKTTGSYSVIITDKVYGCKDTVYHTAVDDTCNMCQFFEGFIYENDSCSYNDVFLGTDVKVGSRNYSYLWNTGDTTISIAGKTTGSYSVIITDKVYGCKDTIYKTVVDDTCNVCDSNRFGGYIYENDSCYNNDIDLFTYAYSNSNIVKYKWNTGDTTSSIHNRGAGTYWVRISDPINGCVDTLYITVVDDTCNPCSFFKGYTYSYDGCKANDVVIYTYFPGSDSSNTAGGRVKFIWNTGATSRNLSGVSSGTYTVIATDTVTGCKDTVSITVVDSVYKCCKAYFYTNDSFGGGSATKTYYSWSYSSTGSNITSYSWSYGDGATGTGMNVTKTYGTAGSYTVCHFIATADGCKDTTCKTVIAPPPGRNLKVSHWGSPYVKVASVGKYVYIYYHNVGTTTENAIVEYKYPAGMTVTYSSVTPLSNAGNVVAFAVGSLAPGQSGSIYIKLSVPSSFTLGSYKCDTSVILPVASDVVPSNNTSYECDSVVSSWDPNDKMPNPKGKGEEGAISPDTKEISYLVRFENEGNWRTYKVRVEDEIDPSFDINSLLLGDASHEFRLVKSNRKLIWYFDDIELTPKSVDPTRSHGYIQYSLKLNEGLPLGTQIKNTAYIYFDGNPAIVTNATKNTLKNADAGSSISNSKSENFDFDILRKENVLTFTAKENMSAIRLYDLNGKLILSEEPNKKEYRIEVNGMSNSMYIIHIDMGESTVIKKYKF